MQTVTFIFTSDLHGSTLCWRKFLNAAVEYKVDLALYGGDVAGKALIPVLDKGAGNFEAQVAGANRRVRGAKDLQRLVAEIENAGNYPLVVRQTDYLGLISDSTHRRQVFSSLIKERLGNWLVLARSRLRPAGIELRLMCGNDDPWDLDQVVRNDGWAVDPQVAPYYFRDHEFIGVSGANATPFCCPRDMGEEKLSRWIQVALSKASDLGRSVFVFHAPPFDSQLDVAYELDDTKKIKVIGPGAAKIPVGSKAVRAAILEHQPIASFHGHIHESAGTQLLGRTLCFNPGSEYSRGLVHAFLVRIARDSVVDHVPLVF